MKNKHIKTIDLALIVGTIIILASLSNYASPLIIAPIDNLETTEGAILFEFEKGNMILIDDNLEFSSPKKIYAKNNLIINLDPGKYYWKIGGILESEIKEFTILSKVNLKLKGENGIYKLVNAGNVELQVEIYEKTSIAGKIILEIDESKEVSGTKFIGEQNE